MDKPYLCPERHLEVSNNVIERFSPELKSSKGFYTSEGRFGTDRASP